MPLVSICIPTYNYAAFLGDAVASAVAQTCPDVEILIVDNCSTDATADVAASWVRRDRRVRYLRNDANVGMARNFNLALRAAAGEYVKILCADDWLDARAIERSVAEIERHPGAALVTTGRLLAAARDRASGLVAYARTLRAVRGADAIRRCLFGTNYIGEPSATLFPRRLAARGFDESYPHLVDLEMWFHLLEQGSLVCIPEPLTCVRIHQGQGTQANLRARQILADKKRLYAAYGSRDYIRSTPRERAMWKLRMAYNAWTADRAAGGARTAGVAEFVPPAVFYAALPFLRASHGLRALMRRARYRVKRPPVAQ